MRRLAAFGGIVGALLLLGVALALYAVERLDRPGPAAADTVVHIPRGSGLRGIAARLEEGGVIEDALAFRLGARILGATRGLKAGEYRFAAAISLRGAIEVLRGGKTVMRRLTLPEGVTSAEAVAVVEEAEGLDGHVGSPPPQGSLLPETYLYQRGDGRAEIIARMQAALDRALDQLWPARIEDLPFSTRREAVILASIVEKETAVAEERPIVASVFVNRLNRGMRLQSDPTVAYGITRGARLLGRALTRKDLRSPSPYNTYLIDGLPPGPIANPGRASIAAALNPAPTEFLYFVADGKGGHSFAKTLAEHNRNVSRWRRLRRQEK